MTLLTKRLNIMLLSIASILLIPLVAMQFTSEVNWALSDFLVMGILLLATGLTCELVLRKVKKVEHRIMLVGVALLALFLIWAELAVGIFGTPFAGS